MPPDPVIAPQLVYPALFGKFPAHGDFVVRSIGAGLTDRLDLWLSNWLALGREAAAQDFETVYAGAAPWLWAGPRATAVLMPSIDSVGRKFPVLVLCQSGCVLQQIYDLTIAALSQGWSGDRLHRSLALLERGTAPDVEGGWFLPDGAEQSLPLPSEATGWDEVRRVFQ